MSRRRGLLLFLAFAALFLIANHNAYSGYFQDDEIDNLSWTPYLSAIDYLKGLATPLYYPNNFRPVGHLYFYLVEAAAGLNFPVYVAVIQVVHLLNVWLLWLIVRRLGAGLLAASCACLFFGLHMALFDVFWKPMYVFDLLCATFSLTAIWCWSRRSFVASFVAFWLAYKSKELAVMLPVLLASYEWWFGKRRWQPLLPFFAASLSFGLQSMLRNQNQNTEYAFRFTWAALTATAPFYAGRLFLTRYLGFAVLLLAPIARNRRTWFGLTAMALFLLPLLFLPGRVFSAYCYLPLTGLAIALTGLAEVATPYSLAAIVALMLPLNLRELRINSRDTLARDRDNEAWMSAVRQLSTTHPELRKFILFGAPAGFHQWGAEGTLKYYYKRADLTVQLSNDPNAAGLPGALLAWDPVLHRVTITLR